MKNRSQDYYINQRNRANRRKRNIIKYSWGREADEVFAHKNLSKQSLSCGCYLCTQKTKYLGWSASDRRKMAKGDYTQEIISEKLNKMSDEGFVDMITGMDTLAEEAIKSIEK